jgi:hypothetical protein
MSFFARRNTHSNRVYVAVVVCATEILGRKINPDPASTMMIRRPNAAPLPLKHRASLLLYHWPCVNPSWLYNPFRDPPGPVYGGRKQPAGPDLRDRMTRQGAPAAVARKS